MAAGGTSPRGTHIRDGLSLMCAGVGGWGAAPLMGEPGWALPALAAGTLSGTGVAAAGHRRQRRAQLLDRASAAVAPLLGVSNSKTQGLVQASRWTNGWPGRPRRLQLNYGTGRIKLTDAAVEIGDKRWAGEVARALGSRLEGTYQIVDNDPSRGRLTLKLRTVVDEAKETPETPQVVRAKRVVNELLGSTATFDQVAVDAAGEVRHLAVKHEVGSKLVAPGYRRRVERSVSVMLPGRWRAQWDMEGDRVTFEVRPTLPESVWIPALPLPDEDPLSNYRAVEVPYGVDEDGEVMTWRPAVSPQWLLTGGTGSGKTSTTHAILARITQYGWPVWIADGKGVEFLGFRDWPNVQIVASRIEQQVAVIRRAWELMEYRYQLVVDGMARSEDFEPLIVFIDEFTDLKANLLTWYTEIKVKGDPTKPPTLGEIGSIARKGRTSRVHMVLAMQRPDAEILTGEARENFGQRTSMGPLSPEGAQMMWNNPVTGVTLPRGRIGRAIGLNSDGVPVEMQCYRVPDPKDVAPGGVEHELLMSLRPAESLQERLVIVPPEIDWGVDEPEDPTFNDYARADWDTAANRPDLDPLANQADGTSPRTDGRSLSSPMTLLGLGGDRPAVERGAQPPRRAELELDGTSPAVVELVDDFELDDGYAAVVSVAPASLRVGDLICVDAELDAWAVVEDEPMADFDDDEFLVIAWRDDQDSSGQLSVPTDALIPARRPEGSV